MTSTPPLEPPASRPFGGARRLDDLHSFTAEDLKRCPAGDGVRVAVVDSGVDGSLLGPGADARSFYVRASGLLCAVERCAPFDVQHHGTAVASVLRAFTPGAELTSVRVLDEQGRGSTSALRAALEFCIRERFDVVNVSLGTRRRDAALDVYDLVDQASVARVVLVCATDSAGAPDYPAACTALLSVDRMKTDDPFALRFREGHRVAFLARGENIEVARPGGGTTLVTGSSFACPHVASFAARLRAARPGLHPFEIKTALRSIALRAAVAAAGER